VPIANPSPNPYPDQVPIAFSTNTVLCEALTQGTLVPSSGVSLHWTNPSPNPNPNPNLNPRQRRGHRANPNPNPSQAEEECRSVLEGLVAMVAEEVRLPRARGRGRGPSPNLSPNP